MPRTISKKPTNLSLDQNLLAEARKFQVNLSNAAEQGIKQAVARAKTEAWKLENADALEDYRRWIEKNGLPLEKYRQF